MFKCAGNSWTLTCSYKHDIILSISSAHSVHSDLGEAVVHVGPDEDRPPCHRVHWVVHERVVTGKLNHVVWETFCRLKAAESLTGTLREGNKTIKKS